MPTNPRLFSWPPAPAAGASSFWDDLWRPAPLAPITGSPFSWDQVDLTRLPWSGSMDGAVAGPGDQALSGAASGGAAAAYPGLTTARPDGRVKAEDLATRGTVGSGRNLASGGAFAGPAGMGATWNGGASTNDPAAATSSLGAGVSQGTEIPPMAPGSKMLLDPTMPPPPASPAPASNWMKPAPTLDQPPAPVTPTPPALQTPPPIPGLGAMVTAPISPGSSFSSRGVSPGSYMAPVSPMGGGGGMGGANSEPSGNSTSLTDLATPWADTRIRAALPAQPIPRTPEEVFRAAAADNPGHIAEALTQAAQAGDIPPLSATQLQLAQAADAQYANLERTAGNAQVAKALARGAGVGAAGLAAFQGGGALASGPGATVGAWVGGLLGAPTGPGEAGAIPAGAATGGAVGYMLGGMSASALATWAARKALDKLGGYNATIASLNAAAQLHPQIEAGGQLLPNLAAAPGALLNLGREGGIAANVVRAAGVGEGAAALAAGKVIGSRVASGAASGLVFEGAVRPAFDGAVYVGAHLLGLPADRPAPPTLNSLLQSAGLGILLAGHSVALKNYTAAEIASVMLRGEARRESGVPPDSADPAHAIAVARNLAARGVPVDGNGNPPAALTAPLSPEEAHLYQALAPQVARLRAAGKITTDDPTGGFTSAEQAVIPQAGGRGVPLAASGKRGVEIPPSAETSSATPNAPSTASTAPGNPPAAPPVRPWGGLGPNDVGQQIETQRGLRGTLQQLTPKAAIYVGPDGARYAVDPQQARRTAQGGDMTPAPASVNAPTFSGEIAKGVPSPAGTPSGPNLPSSPSVPEIPGLREALVGTAAPMVPDEFGIHPLAKPQSNRYENPDDQAHDPAQILASVVRGDEQADQGQRWEPGQQIAGHAKVLARFGAEAALSPEAARRISGGPAEGGGAEHTVHFDPESGRVIKLTSPGSYGGQGNDAGAYLQRLALSNRVFGDHIRFEGYTKLPGEADARAVISQPAIEGRDSTQEEVGAYLQSKGFFRIDQGVWMNPETGLTAWDVDTPGNALTDAQHHVHPIDFQLEPATDLDRERWQRRYGSGRQR